MDDLQRTAEMFLKTVFKLEKIVAHPTISETNRITAAFDAMIAHGWVLVMAELHDIAYRDSETIEELRANPAFSKLEIAIQEIVDDHKEQE